MAWGGVEGVALDALAMHGGGVVWTWKPDHGGKIATSGGVDVGSASTAAHPVVYAGTLNGYFYAVDVATGKTLWAHKAGAPATSEMWGTLGPLVVPGADVVCVGVGGSADPDLDCKASLHCLDRATGAVVWVHPAGKQIQGRPAHGEADPRVC